MNPFNIKRGQDKGNLHKFIDNLAPKLSHLGDFFAAKKGQISAKDLAGHKKAQRLAYECVVEIRSSLRPGLSEKRVAELMDTYLRDCGVKTFFHTSFAWFGERTGFDGFNNYLDFLPRSRELQEGEVVILDVAPILDGYTADIGYTFSLEPNEALAQAQKFLWELREEIPVLFASTKNVAEIYRLVDKKIEQAGYTNRHAYYPGEVLGHRVHKNFLGPLPGLLTPFSLHAYFDLFSRGLYPELLGPYHQGNKRGLWAIEPHIGAKGFGAKFEEILVVEEGQARWLDEEVPHRLNPAQEKI